MFFVVNADEIFLGRNSPMVLKQKINAPFHCEMNLINFPFDTQRCGLHFSLASTRSSYATWNNMFVNYTGNVSF